jgi:uncharacterized damage-inducible protein DinB
MDIADLLLELYSRIPGEIDCAVEGLDADQLCSVVVPGTNSVAWLIWHLTRVQDHHVSELLGTDQLWVTDGWAVRFDREPDPHDTGFGHGPAQVADVRPRSASLLTDHYRAVATRTDAFLRGLTPDDLDRVVDERWDPPVTLGVRLVSIADDDIQHAGQAAYLRGLLLAR